jgi:serine/threonine protein kinase
MNNYHIYAEIGRGKGSTVYKGREKKTIQYVAIKSVEKALKAKVLNEVRSAVRPAGGDERTRRRGDELQWV